MDRSVQSAIEIAKDITVAKMGNSTLQTNAAGGKNAADFFEAIYEMALKIYRENTTQ